MDECTNRVGTGCYRSLLDDRPSGALRSFCLAGDASVYSLALKHHLGKAKDLLAGKKLKMVEWLMFLYNNCVNYICLLLCPPGRVLQDKMVLQDPLENR